MNKSKLSHSIWYNHAQSRHLCANFSLQIAIPSCQSMYICTVLLTLSSIMIQFCDVNLWLYVVCVFCHAYAYCIQLCVANIWLFVVCVVLLCLYIFMLYSCVMDTFCAVCVLLMCLYVPYTAVCCQTFIVCCLYVLSG